MYTSFKVYLVVRKDKDEAYPQAYTSLEAAQRQIKYCDDHLKVVEYEAQATGNEYTSNSSTGNGL